MDGRIDGLVVYAPAHDALVGRLAASHLPVVSIVDALAELPSVGVDDAAGSRMLMEHLWRQGHRRVIYWSAWRSMTASEIRRAAFLDAAALQGMVVQEWNPGDTTEATSALVTEWLQTPRSRRATAVVCWHDAVAYKLLAQCRMRDVRVPEDLAVVGFDGMPSPFGTALRLTTVLAPWLEVARAAVSLLVKSLDGEMPPEETVLPVEFIRGETS